MPGRDDGPLGVVRGELALRGRARLEVPVRPSQPPAEQRDDTLWIE
jgi:hypothetical protein